MSKRGKIKIDLHGHTVPEAIEVLEDGINRAVLGNKESLEVIHGRGTGKVKAAVQSYLKKNKIGEAVREDLSNPGVTWVYF